MSMGSGWTAVGTVRVIARYPLKAAGGEQLDTARMGWHGLHFDRRFALLRVNEQTGLPWISARQFPEVVTWRGIIAPETGDLRVCLPDGGIFDIPERDGEARAAFAARAGELLGENLQMVSLWSGTYDSMTVSLLTTTSIASAAATVSETSLEIDRFRPNIVVETSPTADGWPERKWVGREIRIGEGADATILRVDRHTTRCEVVDLDPATGRASHDLFNAVRAASRNRVGVYATPAHVGVVAVSAPVYLR